MTVYERVHLLPVAAEVRLERRSDVTEFLLRVLEVMGQRGSRPTPADVRAEAVLALVVTHLEDRQDSVYEDLTTALLDGTPITEATPNQLRRDALALYGWARDRTENGNRARGYQMWLRAAEEALTRYRRRRPTRGHKTSPDSLLEVAT